MFKNIFRLRLKLNFWVRFKASMQGSYSCINNQKREIPIVVSISSKEEHFSDLEITLYSLLNQTLRPDKIVLWLSNEYSLSELPYGITGYIKNGLEIRFVKDLGDYTKVIYPLREFPSSIIVTADDCVYYEKDWLKKLYLSYVSNPDDIHSQIVNRIEYNDLTDEILPCKKWTEFISEESAHFENFAVGSGGILYPPGSLIKEVFRDDIYLKNSVGNSDVWMWVISLLSDKKTRVVKSHTRFITCVNLFRYLKENSQRYKTYDTQISNLIPLYGQNIKQKLKK